MSIIRHLAKQRLQKTQEENVRREQDKENDNPAKTNDSQQTSQLPPQNESGLGSVDYNSVTEEVENSLNTKRRKEYQTFTAEERYQIGKYASEHGNSAAMRYFKFKHLKESTVRTFKSKYRIQAKSDVRNKRSPKKALLTKQSF